MLNLGSQILSGQIKKGNLIGQIIPKDARVKQPWQQQQERFLRRNVLFGVTRSSWSFPWDFSGKKILNSSHILTHTISNLHFRKGMLLVVNRLWHVFISSCLLNKLDVGASIIKQRKGNEFYTFCAIFPEKSLLSPEILINNN